MEMTQRHSDWHEPLAPAGCSVAATAWKPPAVTSHPSAPTGPDGSHFSPRTPGLSQQALPSPHRTGRPGGPRETRGTAIPRTPERPGAGQTKSKAQSEPDGRRRGRSSPWILHVLGRAAEASAANEGGIPRTQACGLPERTRTNEAWDHPDRTRGPPGRRGSRERRLGGRGWGLAAKGTGRGSCSAVPRRHHAERPDTWS